MTILIHRTRTHIPPKVIFNRSTKLPFHSTSRWYLNSHCNPLLLVGLLEHRFTWSNAQNVTTRQNFRFHSIILHQQTTIYCNTRWSLPWKATVEHGTRNTSKPRAAGIKTVLSEPASELRWDGTTTIRLIHAYKWLSESATDELRRSPPGGGLYRNRSQRE